MSQAANTDLFDSLVPEALNSECQNLLFLLQIKPVQVSKRKLDDFYFFHPRHKWVKKTISNMGEGNLMHIHTRVCICVCLSVCVCVCVCRSRNCFPRFRAIVDIESLFFFRENSIHKKYKKNMSYTIQI